LKEEIGVPHWISLILLTFAVGLDGFAAGIMYGLKRIRIPFLSLLIIAVCSGMIFYFSMQFGSWLTGFISPKYAGGIGALILIGIGAWAIVQFMRGPEPSANVLPSAAEEADLEDAAAKQERGAANGAPAITLLQIEWKRLEIVIRIWRTPSAADMDQSGVISASEAALLGLALSLDSLGAGMGAALLGFPALATSCFIALSSGGFLWCGMRAGRLFAQAKWIRRLSFVPGFILITMGIMKLF
jgi:putative sporulation protein YtaF